MRKGRRAFAIFMAMIMVIALLPTAAFAQDDGAVDSGETLGVENTAGSVDVPETVDTADADVDEGEEADDSFGGFAGDDEFAVEPDDGFAEDETPVEDEVSTEDSELAEDEEILGEDSVTFSMARASGTCKYTAYRSEITGGGRTLIGTYTEDRGSVPTFGGADLTDGRKYMIVGYKVDWQEGANNNKKHSSTELLLPGIYSAVTTVTAYVIDTEKASAGITLTARFVYKDESGNDVELAMPQDYAISYSGTVSVDKGAGVVSTYSTSGTLTAENKVYHGYQGCESRINFGEQSGLLIPGYEFVGKESQEFSSTDYSTVYEEEPYGSENYIIDAFANEAYGAEVTIINRYTKVASHTVTFEGIESKQSVVHNGKATPPTEEPTRDGFRFGGWDFDFDTPITEDITIEAIWVEQVTHTWNAPEADSEEFRSRTTIADKGAEVEAPANPTRIGYEFDGWQDSEPDADGNVTHTARWKIIQFTVTWTDGANEVAKTEVDYGTTMTAPTVEAPDGYRFGGWLNGESDFDLETPITEDITLNAKWIKQVTHTWMNGEETVDSKTADEGAEVEAPANPTRSGYTFTGWTTTTDEWGNVTYTAQWRANSSGGGGTGGGSTGGGDNTGDNTGGDNTGGNGGETIGGGEGGEGEDPAGENDPNGENGGLVDIGDDDTALADRPFTFIDVTKNDWFYDAVYAAWEKGLMNGTTATTFEPNAMTTRGMLVAILYRMEGSPEVVSPNSFSDVAEDMYYADAVAWAAANGIVNGYDDDRFGPDDVLLREQTAAILYRYAEYKGMDITTDGALAFDDADMVSDYAQDAMLWAVSVELMNGMDENTLAPQDGTQRSHMATLLTRLVAMTEVKNETEEG